jgi:hypothetical protein
MHAVLTLAVVYRRMVAIMIQRNYMPYKNCLFYLAQQRVDLLVLAGANINARSLNFKNH